MPKVHQLKTLPMSFLCWTPKQENSPILLWSRNLLLTKWWLVLTVSLTRWRNTWGAERHIFRCICEDSSKQDWLRREHLPLTWVALPHRLRYVPNEYKGKRENKLHVSIFSSCFRFCWGGRWGLSEASWVILTGLLHHDGSYPLNSWAKRNP